jgi:hypothetical protein
MHTPPRDLVVTLGRVRVRRDPQRRHPRRARTVAERVSSCSEGSNFALDAVNILIKSIVGKLRRGDLLLRTCCGLGVVRGVR